MRINECTLVAFSRSHEDSPPDKEGWLWKKAEVNKAFQQQRYFILKGNLLFYFERQTDREPIGVIILEGCTIELVDEYCDRFSFKINFHGGVGGEQLKSSRIYYLATDSQDEMEEWMKILACASHEYMKLMVNELQQKLAELDSIAMSALESPLSSRICDPNNVRSPSPNNSRCASDTALTSSTTLRRKNPFDNMDAFDPFSENQANHTRNHNPLHFDDDHFGANIRPQFSLPANLLDNISMYSSSSNKWLTLHNAYGRKIIEDRKKWSEEKASKVVL